MAPARALRSQLALDRVDHRRRQLQHVGDAAADRGVARHAGDRFGAAVERQNPQRLVGGGEAARQAVDDVLVQRLQVGDLGRRLFELGARRAQALGERAAKQRDREEAEDVQRHGIAGHRAGRQRLRIRGQPGIAAQPGRGEILRQHQAAVEHGAQRRHQQAAAPELDGARRNHRQHVQRGEVAGDAAGEVDERRDQQRVDRRAAGRSASGAARRSAAPARSRWSARRSGRSGRRTDRRRRSRARSPA